MFSIGEIVDDRYKVVDIIGSGGMGTVYKAADLRLGSGQEPHYVAIKRNDVPENNNISAKTKKEAEEAFQREADVLRKLRHPNLPRVTDRSITGDWFVMDFIDGQPLELLLKSVKSLDSTRVLDWVEQLLEALAYLHEENELKKTYIHRDIKPENIILLKNDRIVLIDFGLITQNRSLLSSGKSQQYCAPEQTKRGAQLTSRTDLYSVAVTVCKLLGCHIPPAKSRLQKPETEPLSMLNSTLSAAICDVFYKALELEPASRWESARIMLEALREARKPTIVESVKEGLHKEKVPPPPPKAVLQSFWVWGTTFGTATFACLTAFNVLNSNQFIFQVLSVAGAFFGIALLYIGINYKPGILGSTSSIAFIAQIFISAAITLWMNLDLDKGLSGYWVTMTGYIIFIIIGFVGAFFSQRELE